MELNENADLDSGQVEDLRGSGGGGGGGGFGGLGGIPIPIGGGRLGLLVTAVVVVGMICFGGTFGRNLLGGGGGSPRADNSSLAARCAKGNPDRLQQADCRNWLFVQSIQTYWRDAAQPTFGVAYAPATTRFFRQRVDTGCGQADSGVGPFYCPADHHVYIDLSFYDELANRFGAKGAFAQPYVLAHEYGHHMQSLDGTESRMRQLQQRDQANANRYSVMLELQADCLAGVWAAHATDTTDRQGQPLFTSITDQDITDAVETAGSIGDDTIQKRAGGRVNPDSFTHGTSAQRKQWFLQGYRGGDGRGCDTFRGGT